jgi:hypothetical protein
MSGGAILLSLRRGAVTFATVLLAAWRVSRVNAIAAVHGPPDRAAAPPRLGGTLLRVALILACGRWWYHRACRDGARLAGGASLLVLAVAFTAPSSWRWARGRRRWTGWWRARRGR